MTALQKRNDRFPNPYDIQNSDGTFPALCLVEHARNTIPSAMNNLGLSQGQLNDHIGWDIGIEGVTRKLSDALGIPALYCLYSRLIVDVNRPSGHQELFWTESDGVAIPGNGNLSEEEKRERLDGIYHPYHRTADRLVAEGKNRHGDGLLVIGMHSCTPRLRGGELRPWEIGLSTYDSDDLLDRLASLLGNAGVNAGIHQPYDTRDFSGTSIDTHGRRHGLPQILVEIRQDLIADETGIGKWAGILENVLPLCLPDRV